MTWGLMIDFHHYFPRIYTPRQASNVFVEVETVKCEEYIYKNTWKRLPKNKKNHIYQNIGLRLGHPWGFDHRGLFTTVNYLVIR